MQYRHIRQIICIARYALLAVLIHPIKVNYWLLFSAWIFILCLQQYMVQDPDSLLAMNAMKIILTSDWRRTGHFYTFFLGVWYASTAMLLFSNYNKYCFGYFVTEHIFLDNKIKQFAGWRNWCFGKQKPLINSAQEDVTGTSDKCYLSTESWSDFVFNVESNIYGILWSC